MATHLKRGLRFKVVFTERWRGSHPKKGQLASGAVKAQLRLGTTKCRLQPARHVTFPGSSPGPGREMAQNWVHPGGASAGAHNGQIRPFASPLSGFDLLCSYRCTCPPRQQTCTGVTRDKACRWLRMTYGPARHTTHVLKPQF